MSNEEMKIVVRCPRCDWRVFDKVTPTTGVIELKCPNCRRVVAVDLAAVTGAFVYKATH